MTLPSKRLPFIPRIRSPLTWFNNKLYAVPSWRFGHMSQLWEKRKVKLSPDTSIWSYDVMGGEIGHKADLRQFLQIDFPMVGSRWLINW